MGRAAPSSNAVYSRKNPATAFGAGFWQEQWAYSGWNGAGSSQEQSFNPSSNPGSTSNASSQAPFSWRGVTPGCWWAQSPVLSTPVGPPGPAIPIFALLRSGRCLRAGAGCISVLPGAVKRCLKIKNKRGKVINNQNKQPKTPGCKGDGEDGSAQSTPYRVPAAVEQGSPLPLPQPAHGPGSLQSALDVWVCTTLKARSTLLCYFILFYLNAS